MNDASVNLARATIEVAGLDTLFELLSDGRTDVRLRAGLPSILKDQATSKSAWLQLFGGERGFNSFFKEFLIEKGVPDRLRKAAIAGTLDRSIELFIQSFRIPQIRVNEVSKGKSASMAMLSRLKEFPEYSGYSLEMAEKDLKNMLFSDRKEFFKDLPFFADICLFIPVEEKIAFRMARLIKLVPYFEGFSDLPRKKKNDLVFGIFGMFDLLNCPWLFIEILEAYPALLEEFRDMDLVDEYIRDKNEGEVDEFKLSLLLDYLMISEEGDLTTKVELLTSFPLYNQLHSSSIRGRYSEIVGKLNGVAGKIAAHDPSFAVNDRLLGFGKASSIFSLDVACMDINMVGIAFSEVLSTDYFRSLGNKDIEKQKLIEDLKTLGTNDIQAALEIAERVKALAATISDAPDDLKGRILKAQELYFRLVSKYEVDNESPKASEDAVPSLDDKDYELLKSANESKELEITALKDQLAKAQSSLELALSDSKISEERNEVLREKISEQKKEIGKLKALKNAVVLPETNKPVVYSDGLIKEVAEKVSGGIKTPEDLLKIYSTLYSDRLVVLDSAFESAKKAPEFRNLEKLGRALFILLNDYYNALSDGVPDAQSRLLFGTKMFRESESDTVLANDKMRSQREFIYEGEKIVFEKHLALGIKYGATHSMRVYFENIRGKIVIAYCGEHLGNTRTS